MGVCVIVLGIPRSGTSAAAGLLHEVLGVPMGIDLMPPMPGVNDMGFFEDMEFVKTHIELMQSHEDPQIEFSMPAAALDRWSSLIAARESRHRLWGVKDPKMCFLLPHFLRRLVHEPRLIVCHRPFHRCVRSMQPLYGGMSLERTVTLQARYLYSLSKNLAAFQGARVDVSHDELVDDTATCLERIADLIELPLTDQQFQAAARFVSRELRRH